MYVNGVRRDDEYVRHNSSLAKRSVRLCCFLTVRETLVFAAFAQARPLLEKAEREDRLAAVVNALCLSGNLEERIGPSPFTTVTDGQRRLAYIATKLLSGPKILFLDEPTIGLGASDALHVMNCIRRLVDQTQVCENFKSNMEGARS